MSTHSAVTTKELLDEKRQRKRKLFFRKSKAQRKPQFITRAFRVSGVSDAIFCCAGDSHSAVLTKDGTVWIWGTFRDANGRMGATAGNTDDKEMSKAIIKEPAKLEISKKVDQI